LKTRRPTQKEGWQQLETKKTNAKRKMVELENMKTNKKKKEDNYDLKTCKPMQQKKICCTLKIGGQHIKDNNCNL
jgi:hypothetical protein